MYCTKCGRKLEDGEVCTCTQKTQVPHMQADPAQVKTPQMEQRQASGEQEQHDGFKIIVTKAVLLTVIMLIVAVSIGKKLQGWIEIPYGNVLLMMVAVTLGADWLETALLRFFNGVFKGNASKNAMYAVVGTRAVYDLATILVTVILFKFVDVIALGIGAALVLLSAYVEFAAYIHVGEMDEDKKAIAFFIAKICTLIIVALVVAALGKDILYIITNWNNLGYYMN